MCQGFAATLHATSLNLLNSLRKEVLSLFPFYKGGKGSAERLRASLWAASQCEWRWGLPELSPFDCAQLSEMHLEYVEVVVIWGCLIVGINLAGENLFPFMICFSFHSI